MQTGGGSWDRGGRFDHSSPEAIARIYLDVVEGVRPDLAARIMSHDVAAQEQLILGFEMGLGEPKEEAIELLGESLEALGMPWRAARLRHWTHNRWLLPAWLLLSCSLPAQNLRPQALQAQALPAQNSRDGWQRVPDVMTALAVGAGSRVADVGAGRGYFTTHLSREVGPNGRVFAVDISDRALGQLVRLVETEGLENVDVIRGEIEDPGLPEGSLDAVLMVDAYHEMTEHEAMLARVYGALKPGGRLVILDLVPPDSSAARDRQTANHRLGLSLVEREVGEAGFEVIERDPRFTRSGRGSGQWMLVARRPASPRWDSTPRRR